MLFRSIGDQYWTLTTYNETNLYTFDNDSLDGFNKLFGLVFRTEKEAKAELKRLKNVAEIRQWIEQQNKTWKPNFKKCTERKYYLLYDEKEKRIKYSYCLYKSARAQWKLIRSQRKADGIIKKFSKERLIEFIEA